ncbi:unnamed protein product [Adineta steineri]|uniref:NAD(P)(+)--arginine ADP-ribosyltransferase n=1 Tax=Adineta steineri TaxID=433720 RepID=A0A814YAI2_9BILA|nr:unnamed protein product [Adineta steineri]CAF3986227.1 unnamed protein product [Adineta steineri]
MAKNYYHGDPTILKAINEFSSCYRSNEALHWYTKLSFPYKLLNKAFRTEDYDLIMSFLFFIIDLKECLAREYCHLKEEETITLYRGVNMPSEELEKLKQLENNLISMNGFLSTSRSETVSQMFSGYTNDVCGKAAVIFKIECNTSVLDENLILADIAKYSMIPSEEEVLIDIGTVFFIQKIKQDSDGTWIINMIGTTEVSSISKQYIECYQLDPYGGESHFTELLKHSALHEDRLRYEKAQKHLERLLSKPNAEEIAQVYITMCRAENLTADHEILIRDYYDYIRDRFSTGDFKQLARTLNKIGFFLPCNNSIRQQENILRLLEIDKDSPYDLSGTDSFSSVLPYFQNSYQSFVALRDYENIYTSSQYNIGGGNLTSNGPMNSFIFDNTGMRLQHPLTEHESATIKENTQMANLVLNFFLKTKNSFGDRENQ